MIQLNGKCKEKFLEWYWNEWFDDKERNYYEEKEIAVKALYTTDTVFLNALIIEFFDSIEIIIQIHNVCDDWWFRVKSKTKTIKSEKYNEYKNRQQATIQAIKKANEIYNERFK